MVKTPVLVATTLTSLLLAFSPAHAQTATRAWVSGHGTDAAGCGAPTNPCRSFQYVHDNIIAAGGEIDVRDPAGYGALTIAKALSVVNDGVGAAGVQAASGAAITINAGASDAVTLRGLTIDGLGTGENGIVFNSGGSLTVVNCVIRHFAGVGLSGNGVLLMPASGSMSFLISNVTAADNGYVGVFFLAPRHGAASVVGAVDRVTATNNNYGLYFDGRNADSGAAAISVSNSIGSNNATAGISAGTTNAAVTVSIDSSSMNGNGQYGLFAFGPATVLLGRSVVASNGQDGILNTTSPNGVYSYGDNRINANATDISGALNTADTPQ